jgi:hypothetical protein
MFGSAGKKPNGKSRVNKIRVNHQILEFGYGNGYGQTWFFKGVGSGCYGGVVRRDGACGRKAAA